MSIESSVMYKLSYGLFVLTTRDGEKDNGCIISTAIQTTSTPPQVSIAVNKTSFTHGFIRKTGEFTLSILAESAPLSTFKRFGFQSGKDVDKFADCGYDERAANGIRYVPEHVNGVIAAKVIDSTELPTHTVFFADVTQSLALSDEKSMTYQYYQDNVKSKPQPKKNGKKGFVCKICGYVYEGDTLPADFICPICNRGAEDFEPIR